MNQKIDFELVDYVTNKCYIINVTENQLEKALADKNYYNKLLKRAKKEVGDIPTNNNDLELDEYYDDIEHRTLIDLYNELNKRPKHYLRSNNIEDNSDEENYLSLVRHDRFEFNRFQPLKISNGTERYCNENNNNLKSIDKSKSSGKSINGSNNKELKENKVKINKGSARNIQLSKTQKLNKESFGNISSNEEEELDQKKNEDFRWTEPMILLLLHCYKKYKDFQNPNIITTILWGKLTATFNTYGYDLMSEECRKKFESLMRSYKKCMDHNNQSGNNRKSFEFKEDMDFIFSKDVFIAPVSTASSDKYDDSDDDLHRESQPKRKKRLSTNDLLVELI